MSSSYKESMYNKFSKEVYSSPTYIGLIEILEYIIFIIIIYKYNPFGINTKHPAITSILTLIVALIYVLLFYFLRDKISIGSNIDNNSPTEADFLIKLISTIACFIGFIFITKYVLLFISKGHFSILSIIRYIILFFIIVVAIATIYMLFKPMFSIAKNSDPKTVKSFIYNLIMYLPCLLINFMDFVKHEYSITTKSVWLLLIAEIILITLWIIVPMIIKSFSTKNGVQLLREPQYLNEERVLGTFEELYGKNLAPLDNGDNSQEKFNYHYSLSMWFNLNPQPPNTSPAYNKWTNIFNYGSKPVIEFNGQLNILRIVVESEKEPGKKKKVLIYKTNKILFQKWNNIVINYDRGTMDVFLNGELVASKPEIAPYMTYESIQVGAKNGINGGICNVLYFKDNLTKNYIELMYNSLRFKYEPYV